MTCSIGGVFNKLNKSLVGKTRKNKCTWCDSAARNINFKNIATRKSRFSRKLQKRRRVSRRVRRVKKRRTIKKGGGAVENNANANTNTNTNSNPLDYLKNRFWGDTKEKLAEGQALLKQKVASAVALGEMKYKETKRDVKNTYENVASTIKKNVKSGVKKTKDRKDSFLCNRAVDLMNRSQKARFKNIDCGNANNTGVTSGAKPKAGAKPGMAGAKPKAGARPGERHANHRALNRNKN